MRFAVVLIGFTFLLGCASSPTAPSPAHSAGHAAAPKAEPIERDTQVTTGLVQIDITDVLGNDLHAKVEFRRDPGPAGQPITFDVPSGRRQARPPVGPYTAYVYVYDAGSLILVDAQELHVREDKPAYLLVTLLEGASGTRPLRAFDKDHDGAMDRVELSRGTDPADAASLPGHDVLPFVDRVLSTEGRWYRGEFHAHSVYGGGRETVAQLVKRAEKLGLDFLAITDRNTLAACMDPAFRSDKVVLIPAMEWGNDEMGVALVYGPRTMPPPPDTVAEAQTLSDRVQAQGGIFAVAHPCFSTSPWQWNVRHVNAIEVWCHGWRDVPPMWTELLNEDLTERREGKLVYSMASAAATTGLSANGQAALFWDKELAKGLKACVIAGSGTASPKVPMAVPVTYVYAYKKSAAGILDGLRRGRTFLSSDLRGPRVRFLADVLADDRIDVNIGGVVPVGLETKFEVGVENARGKKLQVLRNGYPILTSIIEGDHFVQRFSEFPEQPAAYWVRVIDKAVGNGFGAVDVLALSSPIYAEDITQQLLLAHPELEPDKAWIEMRRDPTEPGVIDQRWFTPGAVSATEAAPKWQY